jgi:hypothetical protein
VATRCADLHRILRTLHSIGVHSCSATGVLCGRSAGSCIALTGLIDFMTDQSFFTFEVSPEVRDIRCRILWASQRSRSG